MKSTSINSLIAASVCALFSTVAAAQSLEAIKAQGDDFNINMPVKAIPVSWTTGFLGLFTPDGDDQSYSSASSIPMTIEISEFTNKGYSYDFARKAWLDRNGKALTREKFKAEFQEDFITWNDNAVANLRGLPLDDAQAAARQCEEASALLKTGRYTFQISAPYFDENSMHVVTVTISREKQP